LAAATTGDLSRYPFTVGAAEYQDKSKMWNVYPKRKINDAKHSKPSLNTRVPIFPFISLHFHY
jgi:hypothetical protein